MDYPLEAETSDTTFPHMITCECFLPVYPSHASAFPSASEHDFDQNLFWYLVNRTYEDNANNEYVTSTNADTCRTADYRIDSFLQENSV